ncbi:MAG: hypothetical protein GQ574_12655 [Crocinitomix sp.]|nr:hypothetical protein [Crocinitomix sp.]
MKTIIRKGVSMAILTMAMGTGYAQLNLSAEVRPRAEYRHGYKTLPATDSENAMYVGQRTRLKFDFKKDRIALKITLQDVRTWGSQKQLVGNEDFGTSIHEAWGLVNLTENFDMKFGRQELVYDDHRIFGSVGWAQQARSHDALLFKFKNDKLKLDFGGAFNQDSPKLNTTSYTVGGSYKTMQYLWANYAFSKTFKASILAMGVGQQVNYVNVDGIDRNQDNYTMTAGTRLVYKKEKLSASFNGYYQMGSTNTWPAMDVSAYNICLDLGFQVADPLKVSAGFEILSGNSQTDVSTGDFVQQAFNPYFGTNHKFNGYMDYFYVGNHIGNVGLNDLYLRLDYKHKKFTTGITGHIFMANAEVRDWEEFVATGTVAAMDPYLGTEIDLFGSFKLAPGATCKLGYSHLLGTSTMEAIKGGDMNEVSNWGYVMIILSPTLFEQK